VDRFVHFLGHMVAHNYRELIAWQLADALDSEVIGLVTGSTTCNDLRYRGQILDASGGIPSNIAEGFLRRSNAEFARFLDFAFSGIGEVETRLRHGIKRKFFSEAQCVRAFELCRRCSVATIRLKKSQQK
jgi:four helix bundle protein